MSNGTPLNWSRLRHLGNLRFKCLTCGTTVAGTIAALGHATSCRRKP